MKDEEKAEEYLTRTVCQGCRNICEGDCAYAKPVRQAFLDGLKAGRPQWHDLRKQIPTENKMYLVAIKDNGLAIAYFNGKHWETKYNLGDFGHCVETVIAWCEIPTFDKE